MFTWLVFQAPRLTYSPEYCKAICETTNYIQMLITWVSGGPESTRIKPTPSAKRCIWRRHYRFLQNESHISLMHIIRCTLQHIQTAPAARVSKWNIGVNYQFWRSICCMVHYWVIGDYKLLNLILSLFFNLGWRSRLTVEWGIWHERRTVTMWFSRIHAWKIWNHFGSGKYREASKCSKSC